MMLADTEHTGIDEARKRIAESTLSYDGEGNIIRHTRSGRNYCLGSLSFNPEFVEDDELNQTYLSMFCASPRLLKRCKELLAWLETYGEHSPDMTAQLQLTRDTILDAEGQP